MSESIESLSRPTIRPAKASARVESNSVTVMVAPSESMRPGAAGRFGGAPLARKRQDLGDLLVGQEVEDQLVHDEWLLHQEPVGGAGDDRQLGIGKRIHHGSDVAEG